MQPNPLPEKTLKNGPTGRFSNAWIGAMPYKRIRLEGTGMIKQNHYWKGKADQGCNYNHMAVSRGWCNYASFKVDSNWRTTTPRAHSDHRGVSMATCHICMCMFPVPPWSASCAQLQCTVKGHGHDHVVGAALFDQAGDWGSSIGGLHTSHSNWGWYMKAGLVHGGHNANGHCEYTPTAL